MLENNTIKSSLKEGPTQPNQIENFSDSILLKVESILLKNGVRKIEVNELFKRYVQGGYKKEIAFGQYLQERYKHFYQIILEDLSQKNKKQDSKFCLGDWLVFFGDITEEQLKNTLDFQEKYFHKHQKQVPLGKILVNQGYISKQRLGEIGSILGFMKLGEYLVCHNLVSGADMIKSIKQGIATNTLLGVVLIQNKLIPKDLLYPILKKLKIIRTGEYFVYEGIITPKQLHIAHEKHSQTQKPLGEILLKENFITLHQLNQYLIFMGKTPKAEELALESMEITKRY